MYRNKYVIYRSITSTRENALFSLEKIYNENHSVANVPVIELKVTLKRYIYISRKLLLLITTRPECCKSVFVLVCSSTWNLNT